MMYEEIILSGKDEVKTLLGKDGVDIMLPADNELTSKLVTMDKIVNNKWNRPAVQERFVSTTQVYIAYPIQHAKTKEWMMKIMNKDDISKKTAIKDITGKVKEFMFKKNNSEDDTFVVLSQSEAMLYLSIYDIVVTENGGIDHIMKFSIPLSSNPTVDCNPVLAVQPHDEDQDEDDILVTVAMGLTIYIIKSEEEVKEVKLAGVTSPVVSMYIANDEENTMATCSRDGTLSFFSEIDPESKEERDPWNPFPDTENIHVIWAAFLDSPFVESDSQWHTMLIATKSSLYIMSLEYWQIFYRVNLMPTMPESSSDIRYNIATRGDCLILSAQCYIYLLKMKYDKETGGVIGFSNVFCYPIKNELYDFSIVDATKEKTVRDGFELQKSLDMFSDRTTLSLIVISSSAMYRMTVLADSKNTSIEPITTSDDSDIIIKACSPIILRIEDEPASSHVETAPTTKTIITDPYVLHLSENLVVEGEEDTTSVDKELRTLFESKDNLDESEICSDLIEYYNTTIRSVNMHPTSFNQLFSKHLILHTLSSPGIIRDITVNFRKTGLDEDFCCIFLQYLGLLLAEPMWRFALDNSQNVIKLINDLYLADVMISHNMLRIFEKFVKSYWDIQDCCPDLFDDWSKFIYNNIKLLTDSIKSKDKHNQGFIIQISNIIEPLIEPLKFQDPMILPEPCPSDADKTLLDLLTSKKIAEPPAHNPVIKYEGLVGLMSYLDHSSQNATFLSDCEKIVESILKDGGYQVQHYNDIAKELVNNYYSKDWFDALVYHLSKNDIFVSYFFDNLILKMTNWLENVNDDPTEVDVANLWRLIKTWELVANKTTSAKSAANLEQIIRILTLCHASSKCWRRVSEADKATFLVRPIQNWSSVLQAVLQKEATESRHEPVVDQEEYKIASDHRGSDKKDDQPTPQYTFASSDIRETQNKYPEEYTFASSDIRENENKCHEEYTFASSDIRENEYQVSQDIPNAIKGLQRSLNSLKSINQGNVNKQSLRSKLSGAMNKETRIDEELRNCADIFFKKAYSYLQLLLQDFLKKEMIGNYNRLHDEVVSKIDTIQFPINHGEISKETTDIIKTINDEVRTSLLNSLNSKEALKHCAANIIIPHFKVMLDDVYRQFEEVLEEDFAHHVDNLQLTISDVNADETELLRYLSNVENKMKQFQFQQKQMHNSVIRFSQELETTFQTTLQNIQQ